MNNLRSEKGRYFIFLWIISPFISLIFLLRNFRNNSTIWPYLLVSFFVGFTFVVDFESFKDSTRYANELRQVHEEQPTFMNFVLGSYLNTEGRELDIYQQSLTWVVAVFTSDYRWLFALFAVVFGFLWFSSLAILRQSVGYYPGYLSIIVLIAIALLNPIWNINGVRMWTAVQLFFYGFLIYSIQGKRIKGSVLVLLSPLIHFSLFFPVIIFLIMRIVSLKKIDWLFLLYFATFFINELDLNFARSQFENLPGFFQSRSSYLSEEYIESIESRNPNRSWHLVLAGQLEKYSFIIMVVWMFLRHQVLGFKNIPRSLYFFYAFTLVFSALVNIVSSIPSVSRFQVLSNLLIGSLFLLAMNDERFKMPGKLSKLVSAGLMFVILFQVRLGLDYLGAFFFIGNPISSFFIPDNVPFIVFIKSLLS